MPELPEVEITARRLRAGLAGRQVESARAPGVVTMKTVDPPLGALVGQTIANVGRRGKLVLIEFGGLVLVVHMMASGRLQLFDKPASMKDRTSRLLISVTGGGELRLREFGSRQRAWAKVVRAGELELDETLATLGPEAWPPPDAATFASLLDEPRPLHPLLRDQRVIAGIGRSWVDEILWTARLSPFQKGAELSEPERERLRDACESVLGGALDHYEEVIGETVPDKLPMPLSVHGRQTEPCPRCGTPLAAVHFSEYVMTYCPNEQTGGRVLKDRRLSRLLK